MKPRFNNRDRMRVIPILSPHDCIDDAVTELFLDTCTTTEVEVIEEIERSGLIKVEDLE